MFGITGIVELMAELPDAPAKNNEQQQPSQQRNQRILNDEMNFPAACPKARNVNTEP